MNRVLVDTSFLVALGIARDKRHRAACDFLDRYAGELLVPAPVVAETYWHPFELNPNMPLEGEDTAEHIARKYGSTPEQSRANRQRLVDIGDSVGFAFNYGDGMRIYNSFKAHKLLTIFGAERGWQAQTALKLSLFKAYFQDRLNISDEAVLLDVAEAQGMQRDAAAAGEPSLNVIDPALPASQFLDRGSSTTYSSLVLTNARISARSTVVTDGPVALTCLAVGLQPDTPLTTECKTARAY